ncbi:glycosyltransferase 87 family protein [uncultured Microbacterium sp.]|uniref:glycosyltransferase 87 family protein n=1 Tax=uncultured Microbacterium sp. TaxID=191216 RepID=UPI0025DBC894|nr:glycosyltransferase 87 family protein [uncultured Microbacterium sp.]
MSAAAERPARTAPPRPAEPRRSAAVRAGIPLLGLWALFLLAHVYACTIGWVMPALPMGDTVFVYEPWARQALSGGPIMGVTESWVYPQVALLPMLVAQGLSQLIHPLFPGTYAVGSASYVVAWSVLVTVLDAIGFAFLLRGVRARRSRVRRQAALVWIVALVALGPIALFRIDAVTVPLAVVAGLWLLSRPAVASALFTIGAWIKIWPGALLVTAVVLLRRRIRMILAAAIVTIVVVLTLVALGGAANLAGFLSQMSGRGLQIEAVGATPLLWLTQVGVTRIAYSHEILTFQLSGPGVDLVAAALTPLMVVGVVVVAGVALWKLRAGAPARRLLPATMLAMVALLIACNKVGSPQFQVWMLAPVLLWWLFDRPRALVPTVVLLVDYAVTQLVYPVVYDGLLAAQPGPIALLSIRNILVVVLCVLAIRAMVKTPVPRTPKRI